jgi:hypothetical protein
MAETAEAALSRRLPAAGGLACLIRQAAGGKSIFPLLMAEPFHPDPTLLVVAAFSRHPEALAWAQQRLETHYGAIARVSQPYEFCQTDYYEPAMGLGLRKQFFVFHQLIPADCLPEIKLCCNAIEAELARLKRYPEARPVNLDPGMLTLGKFLLATTKDQAHRIYLHNGIYAEVTLRFQAGEFHPWPWTYADYRLPVVRAFLKEARDFYRQRLLEAKKQPEAGKRAQEGG